MARSRTHRNPTPDNLVSEPDNADDHGRTEGSTELEGEVANLRSRLTENQLHTGYLTERVEAIATSIGERFSAIESRKEAMMGVMQPHNLLPIPLTLNSPDLNNLRCFPILLLRSSPER